MRWGLENLQKAIDTQPIEREDPQASYNANGAIYVSDYRYHQNLIQTARQLCAHGIKVFPIKFRFKPPLDGLMWKDKASNDAANIHKLIPNRLCDLAIKYGPDSGVLDIEPDSLRPAKPSSG